MNAVERYSADDRRLVDNVVRPACFSLVAREAGFEPDVAERVTLDRLRWLAIRARLRQREDLERACLLLAGAEDETFERYGLLFFAGLQKHARHGLAFHKPSAQSLTRDEAWLLRVFRSHGDRRMFARMIAWHVEPKAQRWLRFLAAGLATRA